MLERARAGIRRVLDEVCTATGCTYDIDFADGYPPVDNDAALFGLAHQAVPELELIKEPLLIAEDFSFYQRRLPGVFFLLGCGVPAAADDGLPVENPSDDQGCPTYATAALHTDTMLFSEECLLLGLDVYKRLVHMA